jgi:hypothetical protein
VFSHPAWSVWRWYVPETRFCGVLEWRSKMRSIQEERISQLNEKDVQDGDYVLYWMQEAQRARDNHALEYAVQRANELEQPLLVVFGWSGSSRRGSTPTWSTATSPRRTTSRTWALWRIELRLGLLISHALFAVYLGIPVRTPPKKRSCPTPPGRSEELLSRPPQTMCRQARSSS